MKRYWFAAWAVLASLCPTMGRADTGGEASAAALFDAVAASPAALRLLVKALPKGGDLHNHVSGSPYAENYLQWAAAAGYCTDAADSRIVPPPCPAEKSVKQLGERNPFAFARLIDALSTRGVQQGIGAEGVSGHSQFFASFDRFGSIARDETARSVAATRKLAAGDKVSYVELMHNPAALVSHTLAADDLPLDASGLTTFYAREMPAIAPIVAQAMAELDKTESEVRRSLNCGGNGADPACGVVVRYLGWGWRDLPPAQAFRSLILAFALADRDPRYVGVNIVQPEDWVIALRDYDLHMAMFRFLAAKYPHVHRTMHAGELAFGMVPPAELRDHIRKALDAGAERIGHGTDIALEDDALETMARMARDGVAVEVNLTSNDVILGVKGADHPLSLYRRLGVPVVLSTDDEGILRTDMTNEYVRAVREQGLRYPDLKQMARASLEHAFSPGASLWDKGRIGSAVPACAHSFASPQCRSFISGSAKAKLQLGLEEQFDQFETAIVPAQAKMLIGRDLR